MQQDVWIICGVLLLSGVFGISIEQPSLCLLLGSLGLLIWQSYRLYILYRWIKNPKKNPMMRAVGQLQLLHREISQRTLKNKIRKKKISRYLKHFRQAVSALPTAIVLIDNEEKIEWANTYAKTILGIHWPKDNRIRLDNLIRDPKLSILLNQTETPDGIEIQSKSNADLTVSIKIIRYTEKNRMIIASDISHLVKTNKIQSDFVANVSHELKTPLTVLKGYLEIIQDDKTIPNHLEKAMQQMVTQTSRMQSIVYDLLFLAKLENQTNIEHTKTIHASQVIQTICETLQKKIEEKKLNLNLEVDEALTIHGNETELHAAFNNIIINAINYTPSKGHIQIHWHQKENNAIFTVKDNGEGIAPNDIPRLTQRFYRADSDRSRETGGTGLGLAIVKHVLQRHNAELDIQSNINQGSQFSCIFPLQKNTY